LNKTTSVILPQLWSRSFISLLLANLFVYQGILMLIPSFPVYMKQLGGNDFEASLPFALVSISALILRSISGNAADIFGRRPLLTIGLVILFVFNCSYFISSIITIIFVLRFCQGIGWGITSTLLATIMADIVPPTRRGEGTGYFSLSIIMATSLATILGITIMKEYGFNAILCVSTLFVVIGSILAQGISIIPIKKDTASISRRKKITWGHLFEKKALLPAFLCFLYSITLGGIMSFLMLYGQERGIENIWLYFVGHLSMILISRPFAGKLFDRKGHAILILPGIVFMTLGLVTLSYATSMYSLLIASLLYGLGYGATHPSLQAWAIARSPADRKGAASGTFLSSLDIGYAVGAVLLGLLATHTNYAIMYRISTLFLVLFAVVYVSYLLKNKHEFLSKSAEKIA